MASHNEYKRYFIILQEDEKGYEISPGKTPTGYVKIEVKNSRVKLNSFIQNVKPEDGIEYRLMLISAGKRLAVDIGKIIVDSSGRGELSCELESDNVLKSGMNIGDFSVAAVTSGDSVLLSGYTGREKLEWKGRYDVVNRQRPSESERIDKKPPIEEIVPEIPELVMPPIPVAPPEPEVPEEPAAPPEPVIPPEPVCPPEPVVPAEPEAKTEIPPIVLPPIEVVIPKPAPEKPKVIENKVEIEIVVPKCPPMAPIEEPCEIEEKMEVKKPVCEDIKEFYCYDDEVQEECKHFHQKYDKPVVPSYYEGNMYRRLKKLLRRLRRYEPFDKERGYEWFKAGDDIYEMNEVAVPYMGYMMPLGYPFMSEGCSMLLDRKDYILGVKYEDKDDDEDRRLIKYLLYGVPAIYSKRNEQYYRSRGFMRFMPHKSKNYGYFIMCLDLNEGILCQMD